MTSVKWQIAGRINDSLQLFAILRKHKRFL